jgi:predicted RNA-binding Zn-ribbon protein involved in translation (DUF1610 family)
MIRQSRGNAAKDTKRCPQCGFENALIVWGRLAPGEIRLAHTCSACGHLIILDPHRYAAFLARQQSDRS